VFYERNMIIGWNSLFSVLLFSSIWDMQTDRRMDKTRIAAYQNAAQLMFTRKQSAGIVRDFYWSVFRWVCQWKNGNRCL